MIEAKIIDIIVPIYNQETKLLKFLESTLKVSTNKINVILVNDGSTDGTLDVVKLFINNHALNNSYYIFNKTNGGVSSARNFGLEHAKSKFIWFCDPDDEINANINSVIETLIVSEIDVYVCSYEVYKKEDNSLQKVIRENSVYGGADFIVKHNNLSNNYIFPASDGTLWDKLYRRESISCLKFDANLICSEDFDFNLNIFKSAKKVMLLPVIIYKYNVYQEGTLSSIFSEKVFQNRIHAERQTILFLKTVKGSVRYEIKKHIMKNTNLLSTKYDKDPYEFYLNEHSFFSEKICPFSSNKERIFCLLSFFRVYQPLIKLYRYIKVKIRKNI
ncbi:glycosyltransferase family 2 protein [Klebsiella michiganensis]|uniref:glycosyltransferase family 2 protein n=1 Tax=Klebsiella michiganensis TaxID=1134687 RepID=UPI00197F45EE|nr:glycosyltransferase family 2 protein [Klebsiella michiganensis]NBK98683.1 glycosyltransferase family 2 protein [Erysipelotrichia bacterium]MBN4044401.1 glycosyltransferase family 2 protein [Klebsiella michiganensis]MDD9629267.1 glycosyltransferase family 2 protein [Klebsiella michiganensis]MDD9638217.1 glycosyltransferase family 2 protein [Klebsiella michiganensis]MDD9645708.1 glycosyltransferase family 2 protein [Klebsiella michiganensis]